MNTKPAFSNPLTQVDHGQDRLMPVAVGVGLLAAGALLWKAKPGALQIPDPTPLDGAPKGNLVRRAARRSRDGLRHVAPSNIAVSLGRSLVIAGGALLITRLLDELAGDD